MKKQTAGHDVLGEFAPKFAQLNDNVLFGEVWSRTDNLSLRDRCLITVSALIASGIVDSSLEYHLQNAKAHGVSKLEIVETLTHLAFYAGWPKVWPAFRLAQKVWNAAPTEDSPKAAYASNLMFPIGEPNQAFAQYFVGQSYLAPLTTGNLGIFNVTFEPGCRNNWHIHHASSGGGQILVCVGGQGYYQEAGQPARLLNPGDVVEIPANVKHWHGASPSSWFSHLAIEVPGSEAKTEWLEPVVAADYEKLH